MIASRWFPAITVIAMVFFAGAPLMIARAPYESTMGLVQKIFYFHVPAWIVMFSAAFVCGISSGIYLFKGKKLADHLAVAAAELTVLFGLIGLVTGPLWARKAWGLWWQWDARLTSALILWMIFVAYQLLRQYGGPGSDKLAAGMALFGMANVPFVYWSVNVWRTIHPTTNVVPTLVPGMSEAFLWCSVAFVLIFILTLSARVKLESHRAAIDRLYLSLDD
ncbi:MAG: cytochrome c biogenesis protein CcsA [Acidobacteriota bacterium]|nr:cytochrome c biogenesis protein CcsA [Acidobacteriota bacterium]